MRCLRRANLQHRLDTCTMPAWASTPVPPLIELPRAIETRWKKKEEPPAASMLESLTTTSDGGEGVEVGWIASAAARVCSRGSSRGATQDKEGWLEWKYP